MTGDGLVRRKLYTDSDLAVLAFKRCIVLTSIDHGALRGDLGDRLLLVDLERIAADGCECRRYTGSGPPPVGSDPNCDGIPVDTTTWAAQLCDIELPAPLQPGYQATA